MLNFLATCFLSFAVTASSCAVNMEPISKLAEYNDNTYIPEVSINTEAKEVTWWREHLIGRHQFIQITDCEYRGVQNIQSIGYLRNGNVFEGFKLKEEFETITSNTVSTTEKYSSEITTGLQVQANLGNVTISGGITSTVGYEIEHTETYTTSKRESFSIEYEVKQELIEGKRFGLCMAAHVFKLTWQTWMVDDYWWGDYEVSGSRKTHVAYLTINPTLTIYYEDGTVIWDV